MIARTSPPHRRRRGHRPRRGVTLIIVAITLTVFLGFAALAIDLARLVNFRGELKGTADAAAMSAALDLVAARTQATATTNVSTLVGRNPIEGAGSATVTSVTPMTWDFVAGTATTAASWGVANAARVIVSYPMNWTLAKVFNRGTSRTLVDTSIAAFGQRSTHSCLRPIVFPYGVIRSILSLTPGDTSSLSAANIISLAANSTSQTYTVLDTANGAHTTSFGWANTRQGTTGSATDVATALTSCVSGTLGVGSTLQGRPRFGDTTSVRTAASTLCGSTTNCSANNVILVPIYTSGTNTNGTTTTTTTSTPAANQSVTLTVNKNCYNASTSSTYSPSRCSSWVSTLHTASASAPVLVTNGGSTYSCQVGPTYTGRGNVGGNGSNATYYLYFRYSTCFTTTTTTVGSARGASTYVIKYIAGFVWTARTNTTLTGYFKTLNYPPSVGVSWDELPGPITSVVLVK